MHIAEAYWQGSSRQWNLPNAISLSRAVAGVAVPLWWLGGTHVLFLAVVYAGLSDWLDGWLARRQGIVTPLGAVIDPLADKCFTNPFLLGLAITSGSVWLSVLFVVNLLYDIDNTYQRRFDIAAAMRGARAPATKPVTLLSKTKTAVLFGLMIVALYPSLVSFVAPDELAMVSLGLVLASWGLNRAATFRRYFL